MSNPEESTMTRRRVLAGGGVLAAGTVLAIAKGPSILGVMNRLAQHLPDASPSHTPEIIRERPTEYGFATHVFVNPEEGNNMTVDMFKQNIDLLASKVKNGFVSIYGAQKLLQKQIQDTH